MKDYYKILGVSRTATNLEIKSAYRKLSMLYHPDRNNGEEKFNALFAAINEAYQILYKEDSRSRYDRLWQTKDNNSHNYQHSYQQEQSYIQPIITQFFVDRIFFAPGDVITITWSTLHADSIELRPFGFVQAQGVKKIKINQSNAFLEINLVAFNQVSRRYYTSKITLENIQHPNSKNYSKKENPLFNRKNSLLKELFSLEGKIGRFSYCKRMFSIVFFGLFLSPFLLIPLNYSSTASTLLIAVCFALAVIQSVKRLNAMRWSWNYCILFFIPYINILAVLLLFVMPNAKDNK